jgi:NADH-quinone oxidoreductase subunit I
MDQHFEIAATERFQELLLHKEQLAKPNAYYQRLHPTAAGISDGILAEKKRKEEERAAATAAAAAAKAAQAAATPSP